jgi:uncharacterized repeat protein (TIGR03803 family)
MACREQHGEWILSSRVRVATAPLTLVVLFVLGAGTIPPAEAQTFTVLQTFAGSNGEGPYAGLVRDAAGNLYGATSEGGSFGDGVVFKLNPAGKETVLYSFTGVDGKSPNGVIRDARGNLYGTTYTGGSGQCKSDFGIGCGTVFRLDAKGNETVLHSFKGGPDGALPFAGVILDAKGNLYGTTANGGDVSSCNGSGCGVVFKLDPRGKETVLYRFTGGTTDVCNPAGGLLRHSGNLYGTTYSCGASGCGTLFKVDTSGTEILLHSFAGGTIDGAEPYAGLVQDADGVFYGTTVAGGAFGDGTVFKVSETGKETVLHNFAGGATDGEYPYAGVILDANGNLFGNTFQGGRSNWGTVFELNMKKGPTGRSAHITLLHSFTGSEGGGGPYGGVIRNAGNFYGTTSGGGRRGYGTVWQITK